MIYWSLHVWTTSVSFFSDTLKSAGLRIQRYWLQVGRFCRWPLKNINRHLIFLTFLILQLNRVICTSSLSLLSLSFFACFFLSHSLPFFIFFFVFISLLLILLLITHFKIILLQLLWPYQWKLHKIKLNLFWRCDLFISWIFTRPNVW